MLALPQHRQGGRPRTPGCTMNFTPSETEKLLLSVAGMVARDRLARGVRLNHPEAVALLSTWVIERAREGARVADRTDDERLSLVIVNTGDRPVQIGSHLHLPDANTALAFDREAAQGFRLDIPSGTSQRFEPGASREVQLVALKGRRQVPGIQVKR